MSHWKKFESKVLDNVDKGILAKATQDLGVTMNTNIRSIKNTWGNERVDAGLMRNGQPIALGYNFKKTQAGLKLELSGDFWGTGLSEGTFMDRLAQAYQKHNAIDKLEAQGWTLESVETNENGELVLEATQWA